MSTIKETRKTITGKIGSPIRYSGNIDSSIPVGGVISVNGKSGVVTLDSGDINYTPEQTVEEKLDSLQEQIEEIQPLDPTKLKTIAGESIVKSTAVGERTNFGVVLYDTDQHTTLTTAEKAQARWNIEAGNYTKPSDGIPKSDLSTSVQASLEKADKSLQPTDDVLQYLGVSTTNPGLEAPVVDGQVITNPRYGSIVDYQLTEEWKGAGSETGSYLSSWKYCGPSASYTGWRIFKKIVDNSIAPSADITQAKIHGLRNSYVVNSGETANHRGYLDEVDNLISDEQTEGSIDYRIKEAVESLDVPVASFPGNTHGLANNAIASIWEADGKIYTTARQLDKTDFLVDDAFDEQQITGLPENRIRIDKRISDLNTNKTFGQGQIIDRIQLDTSSTSGSTVTITSRQLTEADVQGLPADIDRIDTRISELDNTWNRATGKILKSIDIDTSDPETSTVTFTDETIEEVDVNGLPADLTRIDNRITTLDKTWTQTDYNKKQLITKIDINTSSNVGSAVTVESKDLAQSDVDGLPETIQRLDNRITTLNHSQAFSPGQIISNVNINTSSTSASSVEITSRQLVESDVQNLPQDIARIDNRITTLDHTWNEPTGQIIRKIDINTEAVEGNSVVTVESTELTEADVKGLGADITRIDKRISDLDTTWEYSQGKIIDKIDISTSSTGESTVTITDRQLVQEDVDGLPTRLTNIEDSIAAMDHNVSVAAGAHGAEPNIIASITQVDGKLTTTKRILDKNDFLADDAFDLAQVTGLPEHIDRLDSRIDNLDYSVVFPEGAVDAQGNEQQNVIATLTQNEGQISVTKRVLQEKDVKGLPEDINRLDKRINDLDFAELTFTAGKIPNKISQESGLISVSSRDIARTDFISDFFSEDQIENLPEDLAARVKYVDVVDNVSTTTTNVPLSANMGKNLQDQINNLKSIGRFLSIWDATTGQPTSQPTQLPYDYHPGDYFRVGTVATYQHSISMTGTTAAETPQQYNVTFSISNDTTTPYTTIGGLILALSEAGATGGSANVPATGTCGTATVASVAETEYTRLNFQDSSNAVIDYVSLVGGTATVVDTVTKSGVNYRPDGEQYTGAASTVVETETLQQGYVYYYDSTQWILQSGGGSGTVQDVYVGGVSVLSDGIAKITDSTQAELNELHESTVKKEDLTKLHNVTATAAELNTLDGITSTTNELNQLHGSGVTTSDLTKLNSITASATEINQLHDAGAVKADFEKLHAITASATEINTLKGITSTTAELNQLHDSQVVTADLTKLHEVTATSAELNTLDGITATTAELNVLDGIEASTQELNYTKGVTSSIQTQLDSKVVKNADITAGTHTKITYDAKGLVTAGTDLVASDIPELDASKITTGQFPDARIESADTWHAKSVVTVSETGEATNVFKYITIDGVETRIGADPLVPATTTTLGGVIVGNNLTVELDGKLNALPGLVAQSTTPTGDEKFWIDTSVNTYNATDIANYVQANPTGETTGQINTLKIAGVNYSIVGTGGGNIDDVKVNDVSYVSNKIANIPLKTVNNTELTGSGDINIPRGPSAVVVSTTEPTDPDVEIWLNPNGTEIGGGDIAHFGENDILQFETGTGVVVEANPEETPTGTLSTIKIGDTSYTVGSSSPHLYQHNVNLFVGGKKSNIYFTLLENQSIAYTMTTVVAALFAHGGRPHGPIQAFGDYGETSILGKVFSISVESASANKILVKYNTSFTADSSAEFINVSLLDIRDYVIQIF